MSTSNRAPRHVWTKEEEDTLMECLVELVSMGDGNRIMAHSDQVTWPSWPSPKCGSQRAVALGGTTNKNVSLRRKNYLIISHHRAMGRFTETFADVGSNEPGEYDEFDMANGNEVFPPMYNQGIDLSQDDVRISRPSRDSEEWHARALANDNHVCTEFFRILREMSKLTSSDKGLLQRHLLSRMDDLWGFVLMLEDERDGFCRVLLRDIMR
ncbi:retrotransposon protein [Cucumis melo var. makuwa]|uniref:Retrotransposon protein n=1 Tax=Cucumis melo var. makuwa TaxID=1194695 RepID=A0A5D3CLR3_CUCMM|nr:retrotransposon protein [Cucumis melo var. makuwa]TYK12078.1 retrotransposon protein [Cucumis melo var. makuwa]